MTILTTTEIQNGVPIPLIRHGKIDTQFFSTHKDLVHNFHQKNQL